MWQQWEQNKTSVDHILESKDDKVMQKVTDLKKNDDEFQDFFNFYKAAVSL